MSGKFVALIAFVILAFVGVGAERFGNSSSPGVFRQSDSNFVLGGIAQIDEGVSDSASIDTSRIWSRGAAGNAEENATSHFKKHGKEFGFRTEDEYVAAAVAFTTNLSPDVMQNIQRDGDTAFYNPKTAEYAVKSKRGLIRTYFKLDPKIHGFKSNTDYFNAQARAPANDNHKK